MILDKEVEITIGTHNYKHYKELGYNVINPGQKLIIKIENLLLNSSVLANVQCDICGKEKQLQYVKYIKNTKNLTIKYCCSRKCGDFKFKNSKLKKYGDKNYVNSDKSKETKLIKYGNENYNNREQAKETCLEKYGVEFTSQISTHAEKSKQTMMKNYGVNYTLQSAELRNKCKKTMLIKYNNENYRNSAKIKETHLLKTNEEKEKMIKKMKETNLIKYGVESNMHKPDMFEKNQISGKKLKIHETTGLKYRGTYEKHFLDYCFKNNIKIEEAKIIKYKFDEKSKVYHPDFYIKNKNLIVEIKSNYYYNKYLNKNLAKQSSCINQGYNFIFIVDQNYNELLKSL